MKLEKCIKNGFDNCLSNYINSDEYLNAQDIIDDKIKALRTKLNAEQKVMLNDIIDVIPSEDGKMALQAYFHGVVEGIALRKKSDGIMQLHASFGFSFKLD